MFNHIIDKLIVFLYVASIILFSYRDGFSYVTKIFGGLLVIIFLVRIVFFKCRPTIPIEFIFAASWLLFAMLSGLFAINFDTFFRMFLTVSQVITISFVLCNLLIWLDRPLFPLVANYWTCLFLSIYVYFHHLSFSVGGRLEGTLGNANLYGLVLLLSIMFALHQFFSASIFYKIIYLFSIPFLFYMLGETGSRKAMLSVVIFLGVYTFFKFKNEIFKKPIYAVASLTVLIVAGLFSLNYLEQTRHYKRLENLISDVRSGSISRDDESTYYRMKFYQIGYRIAYENPVFGVGLDNFRNEKVSSIGNAVGTYSHSNYIELMACTGFAGLLLYIMIYCSLIIKSVKLRFAKVVGNNIGAYYLVTCVLIIYILYDFAMVSYFEKYSWLILTVIISTYSYLQNESARKSHQLAHLLSDNAP